MLLGEVGARRTGSGSRTQLRPLGKSHGSSLRRTGYLGAWDACRAPCLYHRGSGQATVWSSWEASLLLGQRSLWSGTGPVSGTAAPRPEHTPPGWW